MQPQFIGPMEVGLQRNLEPFMTPDQAFPSLTDAFVFRGRVRKKPGFNLLGRLRRVLVAISQAQITSAAYSTNLLTTIHITETNASIDVGTIVLTIDPGGTPTVLDDNGAGAFVVGSGPLVIDTGQPNSINYITGAISVSFTTNPGTKNVVASFNYFPNLPVMGILARDIELINSQQQITFDQHYAYQYSAGQFSELPSTYLTRWSGTDYDFFWGTTFGYDASNNSLFWVTNNEPAVGFAITAIAGAAAGPPSTANITSAGNNFQIGDTVTFVGVSAGVTNYEVGTVTASGSPFSVTNPGTGIYTNQASITGFAVDLTSNGIKVYNGTTWISAIPVIDGVSFLTGCLMILAFKNRLVVFNPWEGTPTSSIQFQSRVRWSGIGLQNDFSRGWRSDIIGFGGFADAPTDERIVSAGFVKDELVVYFTNSTYKLAYTGNDIEPFVFQKINTELGAESTFSSVNFDNALLAFGNFGLHSTNSLQVERIDDIIPDEVFNISNNNNGPKRVYGIRDYFLEVAYFSYPEIPDGENNENYVPVYPNKILLYNYRNDSWAFFNESFTALGYFRNPSGKTWAELDYLTWAEWDTAWNTGTTSLDFLSIAAGNQQGFVVQITPEDIPTSNTRYILAISGNTITSPNHNIYFGNYVLISNCVGVTNLNGFIYLVTSASANSFTIPSTAVGTYLGGGLIKVLNNIKITSKMFTPFWAFGRRYRLKYAEYLFDNTSDGEVVCNVYVDTKSSDSLNDPSNSNTIDADSSITCLLGNNIIFTHPETLYATQQLAQSVIWHRQYYSAEGETFQIEITLGDTQMHNINVVNSDIVLHGIIFYFEPAGTFQ